MSLDFATEGLPELVAATDTWGLDAAVGLITASPERMAVGDVMDAVAVFSVAGTPEILSAVARGCSFAPCATVTGLWSWSLAEGV